MPIGQRLARTDLVFRRVHRGAIVDGRVLDAAFAGGTGTADDCLSVVRAANAVEAFEADAAANPHASRVGMCGMPVGAVRDIGEKIGVPLDVVDAPTDNLSQHAHIIGSSHRSWDWGELRVRV